MATVATVVLDGVDVTDIALAGSVTRRLNGIDQATVRLPMDDLRNVPVGALLKVYMTTGLDTPVLWHHGRVLQREVSADENFGYAVYNSSNALELWSHRPVRDDDGDFSLPAIIETYQFAPQIVEAMFNNSIDTTAGGGAAPPTKSEGPLRLALGSVATGTVDLTGAPTDWPMTMLELASLLVSTGQLDIVVTPIELDGNDNYGQLDLYNGDYGDDLTATVAFQYGMGVRNVRALRWNQDMTNMCNKLWYYLGPRVLTDADPAGDQHWRANITGDDLGLAYPPGGKLSPPASATNNQIGVRDYSSRQDYDVRMDIRIYDARGDEAVVAHELYRRLWQVEQYLRAAPLDLIHVTPARDTEIGTFGVGDLVLCEAASDVCSGFSGAQRVYEYTVSWDDDNVVELGELQVSSDNEGLSA